jgi:hypothetical protein
MARKWLRDWLVITGLTLVMPQLAAAQVSAEQNASVLFFPKVIADGTRDTVIQLVNSSNAQVSARCFYVSRRQDAVACERTAFTLRLTQNQPTHWVVSTGRPVDANDPGCQPTVLDCNGAGLDPGDVPPAPPAFRGELLCVEVDPSGAPVSDNHLSGIATLKDLTSGAVAKYNAVGAAGLPANNGDGVLCLGGTTSPACPTGAEFSACPQTWMFSHLADGAEDPVIGPGSTVATNVTIVPCAQNLDTEAPAAVTAELLITNEFEQTLSASTTVTCWADLALSAIDPVFQPGLLGSDYAQTRISPGSGSAGVIVVAEQLRSAGADGAKASTILNLHAEGARAESDVIVLPVAAQ